MQLYPSVGESARSVLVINTRYLPENCIALRLEQSIKFYRSRPSSFLLLFFFILFFRFPFFFSLSLPFFYRARIPVYTESDETLGGRRWVVYVSNGLSDFSRVSSLA